MDYWSGLTHHTASGCVDIRANTRQKGSGLVDAPRTGSAVPGKVDEALQHADRLNCRHQIAVRARAASPESIEGALYPGREVH